MSESTELAPISDDETSAAEYLAGGSDPFAAYSKEKEVSRGRKFLRFSGNTGIYTIGDDTVPMDTQFVFNVWDAKRGVLGWSNGKPIHKLMYKIISGKVPPPESMRPELPIMKQTDGWKDNVTLDVRDIDMEYPQLELTLAAEHGGRPINWVIDEYSAEGKKRRQPNGRPYVPIVELNSVTIDTPGGTKYKPVLTIVDWMTDEELEELAQGADDAELAADVDTPAPKDEPKATAAPAEKEDFRSRRGTRK